MLGLALTSAGIRSSPFNAALIIMQNLKDVGIIKLSYNQGHIESIKCIPRDSSITANWQLQIICFQKSQRETNLLFHVVISVTFCNPIKPLLKNN